MPQVLEGSVGMGSQLNTALTTSVAPNTIVTEFISLIPWIGMMIIAAFAIYEVRKMLKGAQKGKLRV